MKCQNKVTNDDYNLSWDNELLQKIMNVSVRGFRKTLSHDDILEAKMVGLWFALLKFNPKLSKFTTYLFSTVGFQCRKIKEAKIKEKNKNYKIKSVIFKNMSKNLSKICYSNNYEYYDLIELVPPLLKDIMNDRFLFGFTLNDISKKYGFSKQTALLKIRKGLKYIKKRIIQIESF